ncbi:30S ribosomal protein S17 [Candidatus Falkowbacteria bacterium]|nr:30S ribosomal protein S17 [Candidatus Falkowbacteria bacterium]
MEKETKKTKLRKLEGVVVSDKQTKTLVVNVESVKIHSKYHRRYKTSKRYSVHDEKEQYKEGDKVVFIECRPLSKNKSWRVLY